MAGRPLIHLQEAALREVIWKLGGSTRRLEAAFGGARGILGFEDFVRGLQRIGFLAEDLEGCGFKDPVEAFRLLDRSGRGSLLVEEVTRPPDAKIRRLCGASATLRRSVSSDSFERSVGSTGSEVYSTREELDTIIGLLRDREQEIQLLHTEMNSLREEQDRHSAVQLDGAIRDLRIQHRHSVEQLQESARSDNVEEFAHSAEARQLEETSMHNSERMLLKEQDCLRMEVKRQQCLRVIEEVEASVEQCHFQYQEMVAYLRSMGEAHAELKVESADLKRSLGVSPLHELRMESEELYSLESQQQTQEVEEQQLENDLKQLRQELSQSDSHTWQVLETVAHDVSELSEHYVAQRVRSKAELQAAEKKLESVKNSTRAKVAELQSIKTKKRQARLSLESESKEIWQRSKEHIRELKAESYQRDEQMQKELAHLEQSRSEFVAEASQSRERAIQMTPPDRPDEAMLREVLLRQQQELQELQKLRKHHSRGKVTELLTELHAAKAHAKNLAVKCEDTWSKLTIEKRKAAEFAVERCEAALEVHAARG